MSILQRAVCAYDFRARRAFSDVRHSYRLSGRDAADRVRWLSVVVLLCIVSSGRCATIGQVDDFQTDVTTSDWGGSHGSKTPAPQRVEGGPEGAGDFYLQLRASDYHIATKNEGQWRGDYVTAGIDSIEMDVNHLEGSDPIGLRLSVIGPGGFFSSTLATPIAAGTWQRYVFGLGADDLVYVNGGTGQLTDTLSSVDTLLIRHDIATNPTPPTQHPQHVVATIGIDNIRAIPEPGGMKLAVMGLCGLAAGLNQQGHRRRAPRAT